jgi:hypothetical protein
VAPEAPWISWRRSRPIFKASPFLNFQFWLVAHQLDLISANPDKLHASFAFERSARFFARAKKFWRLQPSAGSGSLLFEFRGAFTEERAVTFPKKTLFPLAGHGWLLSPSMARASKYLPRS